MARRESSSDNGGGVALPLVDDATVQEKFKLSPEDYGKLPLLCQMALKEAMGMGAEGTGSSNMFMVFSTDYDGDRQEGLFCCRTGEEAIRKFMQYNDYDWDMDFDSSPVAYRLPATHPFGMVRWGELPQTRYTDVEP